MEQWERYFPFWNRLSSEQRLLLSETAQEQAVKKGELMHGGDRDCIGLVIVKSGLLRAYMLTEEGRELTLYRLYEGDICLFSASCIISGIHFDVMVEAEENGVVLHIPPEVYKRLMDTSLDASNYTNQLMAERFSDVMWLLHQRQSQKLESRLAAFLLEEYDRTGSVNLKITHEQLGQHLGSAREVITRLLNRFQTEGLVCLGRGSVKILDVRHLRLLASTNFH